MSWRLTGAKTLPEPRIDDPRSLTILGPGSRRWLPRSCLVDWCDTELILRSFLQTIHRRRCVLDLARWAPLHIADLAFLDDVGLNGCTTIAGRWLPREVSSVLGDFIDLRGVHLARSVKWILSDELAATVRGLADASVVLSTDAEVILRTFHEVIEVVLPVLDGLLVDLGPSTSGEFLDVIASDRGATVEFRSIPGQRTGSLGDVLDLHITRWVRWVCGKIDRCVIILALLN